MAEELFTQLQPVIAAAGLELVDVELRSGVLLVTVDGEGGVDLEALTAANRAVSSVLDEAGPHPRPVHPRGLEPRGGADPADPGPLHQGRRRDGDGQDPAPGAGGPTAPGHAGGRRRRTD